MKAINKQSDITAKINDPHDNINKAGPSGTCHILVLVGAIPIPHPRKLSYNHPDKSTTIGDTWNLSYTRSDVCATIGTHAEPVIYCATVGKNQNVVQSIVINKPLIGQIIVAHNIIIKISHKLC